MTFSAASADAAYNAIAITSVTVSITDNDVGPPPPPPPILPPSGGGLAEGNYAGSKGPVGNNVEGGFGFGRSRLRLPAPAVPRPIFNGPFPDNAGARRVINTAFVHDPSVNEAGNAMPGVAIALSTGLLLALGAVLYAIRPAR